MSNDLGVFICKNFSLRAQKNSKNILFTIYILNLFPHITTLHKDQSSFYRCLVIKKYKCTWYTFYTCMMYLMILVFWIFLFLSIVGVLCGWQKFQKNKFIKPKPLYYDSWYQTVLTITLDFHVLDLGSTVYLFFGKKVHFWSLQKAQACY